MGQKKPIGITSKLTATQTTGVAFANVLGFISPPMEKDGWCKAKISFQYNASSGRGCTAHIAVAGDPINGTVRTVNISAVWTAEIVLHCDKFWVNKDEVVSLQAKYETAANQIAFSAGDREGVLEVTYL